MASNSVLLVLTTVANRADANRLAEMQAVATENNVTDFVLGKAKVTDKKLAFDELMGQQA